MKCFKSLILLMLTVLVISCSKSESENNEYIHPFFLVNGIESTDYPNFMNAIQYSEEQYFDDYNVFCGFKKNTDDYYVWFCNKDYKIIDKITYNFPKQINEDQGYGEVVSCMRSDLFGGIHYLNTIMDCDVLYFDPQYENLKNGFTYLFFFDGSKVRSYKYDTAIGSYLNVRDWYNNSIIVGTSHYDSQDYMCFSDKGEFIKRLKKIDNRRSQFCYDIFNESKGLITIDYDNYMLFSYDDSYWTNYRYLYIDVVSLDNKSFRYIKLQTPFNSDETFRLDSVTLLESNSSYYYVECQLTLFSGTKKTLKIKISKTEDKAEIVE